MAALAAPGAAPAPVRALTTPTCPQCRKHVGFGDQFCMHCGIQLTATVPADSDKGEGRYRSFFLFQAGFDRIEDMLDEDVEQRGARLANFASTRAGAVEHLEA